MSDRPSSPRSSPSNDDDDELDPELVHRILLTDEEDLALLTMSGEPRSDDPHRFGDFLQAREAPTDDSTTKSSLPDRVAATMTRAWCDRVCAETARGEPGPICALLLELHANVRGLIPRRTDLHSLLDDEAVRGLIPSDSSSLLRLVLEAGRAVARLEAPDRAEATEAWIALVISSPDNNNENSTATLLRRDKVRFAVLSTAWLLDKVAVCKHDIQNVKLVRFLVPAIRRHDQGVLWERRRFQRLYGDFDEGCRGATATRGWVRRVRHGGDTIVSFRRALVSTILFSDAADTFPLPEVLAFDAAVLQRIRHAARLAVTGSALALHCCRSDVGDEDDLATARALSSQDELGHERQALARSVARGRGPDGSELTDGLRHAVLSLAEGASRCVGRGGLDTVQQEALCRRAACVLRGEDAVLKLLDARIRDFFAEAPAEEREGWRPPPMRTGVMTGKPVRTAGNAKAALLTDARTRACRQGYSPYAASLAEASWELKKIGDHLTKVFGDHLLHKLFLEEGDDT